MCNLKIRWGLIKKETTALRLTDVSLVPCSDEHMALIKQAAEGVGCF